MYVTTIIFFYPGPPDAPTNCSVVNQTTDSLDVQCLAGFDGGVEQHFLLEVADLQTGLLLANASDKIPEFRVSFFLQEMDLKLNSQVLTFAKKPRHTRLAFFQTCSKMGYDFFCVPLPHFFVPSTALFSTAVFTETNLQNPTPLTFVPLK
jgi:hypothetical protein